MILYYKNDSDILHERGRPHELRCYNNKAFFHEI
jgi:hypothetical protein